MKKAAFLFLSFICFICGACSTQKVINGEKLYSAIQSAIQAQEDSALIASEVAAVCPVYEYGGVYIDDADCVNVLILDITTEQDRFVSEDKVKFQICKYSYGELRDLQENLSEQKEQLSLTSVSINLRKNKVIVEQTISTSSDEFLQQLNEQDAEILKDPRVEITYGTGN